MQQFVTGLATMFLLLQYFKDAFALQYIVFGLKIVQKVNGFTIETLHVRPHAGKAKLKATNFFKKHILVLFAHNFQMEHLAFTIPFTMKAKDIKNVHLFLCKSAIVDF